MSASAKMFDCVELKSRIQAEMASDRVHVGDAEAQKRDGERLEESDEPLARWWRSLTPQSERTSPEP